MSLCKVVNPVDVRHARDQPERVALEKCSHYPWR